MRKDVLLVDLIGTLPAYTAYFYNGLLSNNVDADIVSSKRSEELDNFPFLSTNYKSWYNHYNYKGRYKQYAKLLSWLLNSLLVLIIAPRYKNVHIIWLPLLKDNNWDYYFIKLLKKRNKNVCFTVHATFNHDDYSEIYENRLKRNCQIIPLLFTHSDFTKLDVIKKFSINEKRVITMGHGPMLREFRDTDFSKKNNVFTMSIIGSMKSYKGIEDAIELTHRLVEQGKKIKLILAGKGNENYLKTLKALIARKGLQEHVDCTFRFLQTDEVIRLNQDSDCTLSLYSRIGQSGAAITSLSLGTPVIGYNVGGIPYIIENYKNGYLAPFRNIEKLVGGVEWLLNTKRDVILTQIDVQLDKNSWEYTANVLKENYVN